MTRLLSELVTDQASKRPHATAVVLESESLTFGELDDLSSRLASVLASRGVERGARVCILMDKTPWAIVAMVGVLKAGACYVPLDTASPVSRLAMMLRSCDDRWLLTSSASAGLIGTLLADSPTAGSWLVGWLDHTDPPPLENAELFSLAEILDAPRAMPEGGPTDSDDLAYIMFTSGSTGVPKGVTITHRNVLSFLEWAVPYFGLGRADRNSSHPPLHFDLSVFDIFGSFAGGSQLHLVPRRLNVLAGALTQFIRDSRLTQWFSVPSVLNYMMKADCVAHDDFPDLRRLIWCGEVLPTPSLVYFMERLPHVQFTNLYGPTEATIASSYYTVPEAVTDQLADVPIGTACDGEELLVLDDSRRPVPAGETGDLYIGGVGLSPGYWRDPDKTDAAFFQVEADHGSSRIYRTGDLAWIDGRGLAHYVGRADTQIKSRGYRIELGEIESALHALTDLDEAAVVAIRTDGFEGWTLCCAYVPAGSASVDPAVIGVELRAALPAYMIPQNWLSYERLPTNPNGKIDRPRLRADFEGSVERP